MSQHKRSELYNIVKNKGALNRLKNKWPSVSLKELRDVIKEIEDVPTYFDGLPVFEDNPRIPLNSERIDNNNIHLRHTRFAMDDKFLLLTQENYLDVFNYIRDIFYLVHEQTGIQDMRYQIKLISTERNIVWSTEFTNDYVLLLDHIRDELFKLATEYSEIMGFGGDNVLNEYIEISYIENLYELIRKTKEAYTIGNKKWYVPDTNTNKNCMFVSIITTLKWKENTELLNNHNIRIEKGKDYKRRNKLEEPTYKECGKLFYNLGLNVNVYNDSFELQNEFRYGLNDPINIMISYCHARPMILKSEILKVCSHFKFELIENKIVNYEKPMMKKLHEEKEYNNKIAAYDVETYLIDRVNPDGRQGNDKKFIVYCSGIAFNDGSEIRFEQFYSNDNNIKTLLTYIKANIEFFKNYTFYAHNGAKFDINFIIDELSKDPEIEIISRKTVELSGIIGLAFKYKGCTVYFKDSYRLFQASLSNITKELKVSNIKGELDHNKINENTYKKYESEVRAYHRDDCIGLLQCLNKFGQDFYNQFNINITSGYTGASLSRKVFFTKYYNKKFGSLYGLTNEQDAVIRESYYGGRNECFISGVRNDVYYYDFTSLYPYCGIMPLPHGKCEYVELNLKTPAKIKKYLSKTDKLMFIRCICRGTKRMGIKLPLHCISKDGKNIFPYMKNWTELVLFSREILYGMELGYKYELIDGYTFDKKRIMKDFFFDGFRNKKEEKLKGNVSLSYMWKIIINSGYGFWGYNPFNKDSLKIYDKNDTGWLKDYEDNKLKEYNKHNEIIFTRVKNNRLPDNVNVSVASAITSYSRMLLHQLLNDILNIKGGEIYYCDTDSVMTNIKLSDYPDLVKKYRRNENGNGLGELKNELGYDKDGADLSFDKLILVGCKMYSLSNKEPEILISKLKGFKQNNITKNEMFEVINNLHKNNIVEQEQFMMSCNKQDYMKDLNMRYANITKKFKKLYTKGQRIIKGEYEEIFKPFEI